MKNKIVIFFYSFFIIALISITSSCNKDNNSNNPVGQVPVLTTAAVTAITQTTAKCGGSIISDGGTIITAKGVCWSSVKNPTIADSKTLDGTGAGNFTSDIIGLIYNTTYYVRAYATNSAGTGYGSAMSFKTQQGGGYTITDIDGNIYHTVSIGTQVWMVENLKTTRYNDGIVLPLVTNSTSWLNLTTPAYCWYNNDASAYKNTYGALYNWYAVNTGKLAPKGWHVPTDAEWTTLTTYLGGDTVAGGKLKEIDTTHWQSPNTGATNETGFTALPGGFRDLGGKFYLVGILGRWWCSTEGGTYYAWNRHIDYGNIGVYRNYWEKGIGYSVRCLKD